MKFFSRKYRFALFLLLFLANRALIFAQVPAIEVPRENISADSLAHFLYYATLADPKNDPYGIQYSRKFGWLKLSDKINTDSFWLSTRQFCIERVGEDFFYKHFRMNWRSLRDNGNSEIYEIRYYFFPFDTTATRLDIDSVAHVEMVFKSFDFLGIHEVQTPPYLPDCRGKAAACLFPFDKKEVLKIVAEKGLKCKPGFLPYIELMPDLKWSVSINENDWVFHRFRVDCQTGEASEVRTSHRID